MKSLFKTVALITIFSVLTRAMGFIFRIYLSRSIGAEALGVYQVAFSVFMVLLTMVSSGLPLVISKLTAKYTAKNDKTSEHKMVTASLIVGVLTSILLIGIVLIFNRLFSMIFTDDRCMIILIILLPSVLFSAIYSTFRGSLWGHGSYFGVCVAELFEQVVRIIICILMITVLFSTFDGAISAAASLTIACALSAIFVAVLYFVKGGKLKSPKKMYKEVLKSSVPITGVRLASSLLQPVIAIIIPLRLMAAGFTNSQAMSQLGIATGMTMPLLFIPGALIGSLAMALIPDLSAAVTQNDNKHIEDRIKSSIIFTFFVSAIFVPLFLGAGENIGVFLYNNAQSGILLESAAWIMIPMGLVNITSSILNALGLELKSMRNYIMGSVLLLICLWFLPTLIGVKALIWGMGLCTLTASFLNIKMIQKKTKVKLKLTKTFFMLILIMIPTAAITNFLSGLLSFIFPLFINIALSCSVGAAFYILLAVIFKVVDVNIYYTNFKDKFKSKWKKPKKKKTV